MNELSEIDLSLLNKLRKMIEERAGLAGKTDLNQKDFDFLLYYIQDKTGQQLSLTTIKRIWRNEFQRLPHLSTLNMLAHLAFDSDWFTLRKEFVDDQKTVARESDGAIHQSPPIHNTVFIPQRKGYVKILAFIAAALVIVLSISLWWTITRHNLNMEQVTFSAVPTADMRIPNSVIFTYDVSRIDADHFYLQQSWDEAKRVEILKANKTQTDIYYEPGYHYAKLFADNQVIKEIPVHIQYNDWYVRFRFMNGTLTKVNDADLVTDKYLGLTHDFASTRFTPPKDEAFQLGYMLSREFNLSADNFNISASVKFDSVHVPVCPTIDLLIKGNRDYAWITFGNIGCESTLGMKVGNKYVDGKTNDLSSLGINTFTWQNLQVKISDGNFKLFVNKTLAYENHYTNSLGDLKEIDFFFNGIGSINEVKISDGEEGLHIGTRKESMETGGGD